MVMKSAAVAISLLWLLFSATNACAQKADSIQSPTRSWIIDPLSMQKKYVPIDTVLYQFHILNKAYRNSFSNTFLGNIGAPVMSNLYYSRQAYPDFLFLSPYLPYIHYAVLNRYYNTHRPFTEIAYSTAGSKVNLEQTLHVIHTQNITKDFNAGLLYDIISSEGQYTNQKTKDNAFTFFTSFEKERYSLYVNYNLNKMKVNENGGIVNDMDLKELATKDIAVNLDETFNGSASSLGNRSFLLAHKYRFLRHTLEKDSLRVDSTTHRQLIEPSFSHILSFTLDHRSYKDQMPASGYYDHIYINPDRTNDSVSCRNLTNTLRFEFLTDTTRKFSFLGRAGITSELVKYGFVIPTDTFVHTKSPAVVPIPGAVIVFYNNDTIFRHYREVPYHNVGANFYMQSSLTKYVRWDFLGELFLLGYKRGDLSLQGGFDFSIPSKRMPLELTTRLVIKKERPEYFLNSYSSNHVVWDHNFADMASTVISGRLTMPEQKIYAGFIYGLFDNFVFLDTAAISRQETTPLSVIALDMEKRFEIGKFRSVNKASLQWTGNMSVLSLPFFCFYHSSYFEHRLYFKFTEGKIFYQVGFDFYYNTSFYAQAYMPATGLFYNQVEKKLGNYPYLDLFLNLKLKRVRFFLKLEHVNSGLLNASYFGALHYPMNARMFKFGLSWTFYD